MRVRLSGDGPQASNRASTGAAHDLLNRTHGALCLLVSRGAGGVPFLHPGCRTCFDSRPALQQRGVPTALEVQVPRRTVHHSAAAAAQILQCRVAAVAKGCAAGSNSAHSTRHRGAVIRHLGSWGCVSTEHLL